MPKQWDFDDHGVATANANALLLLFYTTQPDLSHDVYVQA